MILVFSPLGDVAAYCLWHRAKFSKVVCDRFYDRRAHPRRYALVRSPSDIAPKATCNGVLQKEVKLVYYKHAPHNQVHVHAKRSDCLCSK